MDTAHRFIAAAATALLAVATPAVTIAQEPTPPEDQAAEEVPWPPESTENTTEYVFDVCDLLDQAAAGEQPDLPAPTD
ncbi:hypothetical protein [Kocuria sp. NPDC057446]|uniref:hypothetical protein n=1 Tax=Kocuria sp. NPDC057446 TaxID=3346137 RepID=UPI0036C9FA48